MAAKDKTVRQSVTLPAKVATQVRSLAKRQRLSANRMLIELVEEGLVARQQREKAFFELAERFRAATDPKDVARLGEEMGKWFLASNAQNRTVGQIPRSLASALDRENAR